MKESQTDKMATNRKLSGFWPRQFAIKSTRYQRLFDIVIGILAPIFCVLFDPVIFRGHALLPNLRVLNGIMMGIAIVTLSLWFKQVHFLKKRALLVAVIFIVSASYALVLGIKLFRISVIGLEFGIGILGFTPFVTSFVYFRNAVRAFRMWRCVLD